jgi:hypothetical protein
MEEEWELPTSGFHVNPSSSVIRHFLQEEFVYTHSLTMFSFSTFGHSTLSHSMFSRQIYKCRYTVDLV